MPYLNSNHHNNSSLGFLQEGIAPSHAKPESLSDIGFSPSHNTKVKKINILQIQKYIFVYRRYLQTKQWFINAFRTPIKCFGETIENGTY
jgi:hypothetical protein